MKLAVVGSREGADLDHVKAFMRQLEQNYPDTVIVSGGAAGVDQAAEQAWIGRGGEVISLRAKRFDDYNGLEVYGVERWELGLLQQNVFDLIHDLTFDDYVSALKYRDIKIAQECDRLVAFMRPGGSRGSETTADFAEAQGKPVTRFK